jgi:predicted nucleotidyltransferase
MPVWMPEIETRAYRFLAKIAARQLARLDSVLSVYARRSVACGEVNFGKSDIDFYILIRPSDDICTEARNLRDLAGRFAALKRIIPCLGQGDVSTPAELQRWYQARPYTWYRDRAWLWLAGQPCERPHVELTEGEPRDSLLWWFFQVWEYLPRFYRAGDLRNFCNQLLDMINVYGLYTGAFAGPQRRRDVLQYWQSLDPPADKYQELCRAFARGFRGNFRALKPWLYGESLKVCDALYARVAAKLEGERCAAELHSYVPFSFSPRTYLVVDPWRLADVTQALAVMEKNAEVVVSTEKTLKLYLYHRKPWEYATLHANGEPSSLSPPPREALQRAIRFCLHREVPRKVVFTLGRKGDRSLTIGPQYAQCRLYLEHGKIAVSAEDLMQQYQRHYGAWPYSRSASGDAYFLQDYPLVCQTIEEIARQENFAMSAPS